MRKLASWVGPATAGVALLFAGACGLSTGGLDLNGSGSGAASPTSSGSSGHPDASSTGSGAPVSAASSGSGGSVASSSSTSMGGATTVTSSSTVVSSSSTAAVSSSSSSSSVASSSSGGTLTDGADCSNGGDSACQSGYCYTGNGAHECCSTQGLNMGSTCGGCSSCKAAEQTVPGTDGKCEPVKAGQDPNKACSAGKCDGQGNCTCTGDKGDNCKANGTACGGANECSSGFCASGVCCDTACTDTACHSCALKFNSDPTYGNQSYVGTCTPLPIGDGCGSASKSCDMNSGCNLTGGTLSSGCVGGGNCASNACYMGACRPGGQPAGFPCVDQFECVSQKCSGTHLCM